MNRLLASLLALLALLGAAPAAAQLLAPGEKAMAARLDAEHDAPAAGGRVTLALVMTPRPGWHGYWKNPVDAGVPPRIEWRLPPGFEAAEPHYPVPQRLIVAGLMNYVYEGEYAQLIDLAVPAGLAPGTLLPILRRVASDLGAGVLFVEQHVASALKVADRAYVLNHGRLVLEGTAQELRDRPDLLKSSYLGEVAVA